MLVKGYEVEEMHGLVCSIRHLLAEKDYAPIHDLSGSSLVTSATYSAALQATSKTSWKKFFLWISQDLAWANYLTKNLEDLVARAIKGRTYGTRQSIFLSPFVPILLLLNLHHHVVLETLPTH